MGRGVQIEVDTAQLVAYSLRAAAASKEVVIVAELVVEDTAKQVELDAKQRAPELTGELRNSIHAKVDGLHASVETDLRYAPFVEFGTYKDPVQPFLLPAGDAQERKYPATMEAEVVAAVKALLG